LQRPENVLAGYLTWPDYRGQQAPKTILHELGLIAARLQLVEERDELLVIEFHPC